MCVNWFRLHHNRHHIAQNRVELPHLRKYIIHSKIDTFHKGSEKKTIVLIARAQIEMEHAIHIERCFNCDEDCCVMQMKLFVIYLYTIFEERFLCLIQRQIGTGKNWCPCKCCALLSGICVRVASCEKLGCYRINCGKTSICTHEICIVWAACEMEKWGFYWLQVV